MSQLKHSRLRIRSLKASLNDVGEHSRNLRIELFLCDLPMYWNFRRAVNEVRRSLHTSQDERKISQQVLLKDENGICYIIIIDMIRGPGARRKILCDFTRLLSLCRRVALTVLPAPKSLGFLTGRIYGEHPNWAFLCLPSYSNLRRVVNR